MKLGHLLLRFAQRCRGIKCFRGGLSRYPPRQPEIGTMARVAAFSTVTVGFTALAGSGRDGPAAEITDGRKLAEQIGFLGFQLRQRVVHSGLPILAYNNAKICATKKETHRHRTLMSHTRSAPTTGTPEAVGYMLH
jgi:hypothetical protein